MSPTSNLRVAVIGVGAIGRNHARIYAELPGVTLAGVADTDQKTADSVAGRFHVRAYTDYRQLLDVEKPEAVTIAVPTVDHLPVAQAVIERGIHLLVEKPIAFSVSEGQAMIAAAQQAGVTLMVGHVERFNPAIIALKAHLAQGELGRIYQIDARRQGPFPPQVRDVGVVVDLAVHDLDIMRYVTGAEITRVYAEIERRIHRTHEDLLTSLVRLADGTVGTLTINWLTPTKIRELFITGELGMFRVDYLTQDLYFFENAQAHDSEWDTLRVLRGVSEGRMIRHMVAKKEPLRAEQEAFLAAVTGQAPAAVTGADGLQALALAQALVQAGEAHQALRVEI